MKLIVIASEESFREEIPLLESFFRAGLEYFHLRKPSEDIHTYRRFLNKVNSDFHSRIVLHDHYELTREFHLRGIHKNERNASNWGEYTKQVDHRSVSCHSLEELQQLDETMNYAFLSPVFDSISKEGYHGRFAAELLSKKLPKNVPVVALGGVDTSKVDLCRKLGFQGVAVLGSIWKSENPLIAFQKMQQLCQVSESTY